MTKIKCDYSGCGRDDNTILRSDKSQMIETSIECKRAGMRMFTTVQFRKMVVIYYYGSTLIDSKMNRTKICIRGMGREFCLLRLMRIWT